MSRTVMQPAARVFPDVFFSRDGQRPSLLAYLALLLLCTAFFTPGLASLPSTDRDESLFAQASKQMLETGNYVDIRIQDEHRYKKPIGIYWLQSLSVGILNAGHLTEIWAYRLPSTLACAGSVLLTAAIGSLLFDPVVGLLAAIMLAGCLIVNVEARQAKTDACLLFSIMVMQFSLARAYTGQVKGWGFPVLFWTAVAAGILIKGPIILLVLFSTLLWLRITEKNISWFHHLKPRQGIPFALLLTLPWLLAIGIASQGQFFQQSAGHDMLGKVTKGEFRGMIPPGGHLLAFPAVFFPFSLFGLLAIPDSWSSRQIPAVRFCLGWIIPAWVVFELSFTKLPHYPMPMYPAIALLAARALLLGYPILSERRFRFLPPIALGLWLMVGTALALALACAPFLFDKVWQLPAIAAGAALILCQGTALFLVFQKKPSSVLVMALGSLIFGACAFGYTGPSLEHLWLARRVVAIASSANRCPDLQIISATYNEPSLIFAAGTKTLFVPSGDLAAAGMWLDPCKIGLIDDEHAVSFAGAFPASGPQPVVLGTVTGFNAGRGRWMHMTLYHMPLKDPLKTPSKGPPQ